MSILDFLIDILIFFLDNTIGLLPSEFSNFTITQFQNFFTDVSSGMITSFSFLEIFLPIQLILTLLSIIIVSEILLHFGFKGIKYVINIVRGSGG